MERELYKILISIIAIILYTVVPTIIILLVRKRRKYNRQIRAEKMKQNHCIIGCKNCNAQQCPNNPNYIRKLL